MRSSFVVHSPFLRCFKKKEMYTAGVPCGLQHHRVHLPSVFGLYFLFSLGNDLAVEFCYYLVHVTTPPGITLASTHLTTSGICSAFAIASRRVGASTCRHSYRHSPFGWFVFNWTFTWHVMLEPFATLRLVDHLCLMTGQP